MSYIKHCQHCGDWFHADSKKAKYCTESCRRLKSYYNRKQIMDQDDLVHLQEQGCYVDSITSTD